MVCPAAAFSDGDRLCVSASSRGQLRWAARQGDTKDARPLSLTRHAQGLHQRGFGEARRQHRRGLRSGGPWPTRWRNGVSSPTTFPALQPCFGPVHAATTHGSSVSIEDGRGSEIEVRVWRMAAKPKSEGVSPLATARLRRKWASRTKGGGGQKSLSERAWCGVGGERWTRTPIESGPGLQRIKIVAPVQGPW